MRRAQFEILGLAIAVVIISLAVVFLLTFQSPETNTSTTQQYASEQFAQSLLDSWLRTTHPTPGCEEYNIGRYFVWQNNHQGPTQCREEEGLEEEFLDAIRTIVNRYQGVNLQLDIGEETLIGATDECAQASTRSRPGRQHITQYPYRNEPLEIVLWLC